MKILKEKLVLVRGAGDIASGIIYSLATAGFRVVCTEIDKPSCIRTEVSFSSAIFDKFKVLDGITCEFVKNIDDIDKVLDKGNVALIIDEKLEILKKKKFDVLVDAILAKRNTGTNINMADTVIGIGPGFNAGTDCHFVIETMRGHKLGLIYEKGFALENTGIPGSILGHSSDRVMHSPCEGVFHNIKKIGDIVDKGDTLANIEEYVDGISTGKIVELNATIQGVLRGI